MTSHSPTALAHEILGRTLDELPPQTRRLLGLIVEMVESECRVQQVPRAATALAAVGCANAPSGATRSSRSTWLASPSSNTSSCTAAAAASPSSTSSCTTVRRRSGPHVSGLIDVEALRHEL